MTDFLLLKTVHVFAALVFVGNLYTSIFWLWRALQSPEGGALAFALDTLRLTDRVFYWPAFSLLMISGLVNVLANLYGLHHAPWVLLGFTLLALAGLSWGTLQRRLRQRLGQAARGPARTRLARQWFTVAGLTAACPSLAMVAMIYKW